MKTKTNRIISLILALVMIFGAIPMSSIVAVAEAHTHSWTYTADEATKTITATCEGCPFEAVAYAKLQNATKTYDGTALAVIPEWVDGDGAAYTDEGLANLNSSLTYFECKLNAEGREIHGDATNAPVNAGKYFEVLTVDGKSVECTLTIEKKDLSDADVEIYLDGELVVEGEGKHFTWNGYNKKPEISVKIGATTLIARTEFDQVGDYLFSGVTREKEVGAYIVRVTAADNSNYTGEQDFTWYIDKIKPQPEGIDGVTTVTEFTYDGTEKEFVIVPNDTTATIKYALSAEGPFTETVPGQIPAGTYTVYYQLCTNWDDLAHNEIVTGSIDFTILPAPVNVPAAQEDVVYSGNAVDYDPADENITVTYYKEVEGEYVLVDAANVVECGNYKIVLSLDANHCWADASETVEFEFTIGAAEMDVTLNDASMTYGDAEFTDPGFAFDDDQPADFTYEYEVYDGETLIDPADYHTLPAGNYTLKIKKTNNNINYIINPNDATLTVNKKDITVTITANESIWGDDKNLAYTVDGLVNGDTDDVISVTAEITSTTNAGEYTITVEDTTGNYNITNLGEIPNYKVNQRDIATLIDKDTNKSLFVLVDETDEIIEGFEYGNFNIAPEIKLKTATGFLADAEFDANFESRGNISCAHVGVYTIKVDALETSTNWKGTATIYYYISPVQSCTKTYAGVNSQQKLNVYTNEQNEIVLGGFTVMFKESADKPYNITLEDMPTFQDAGEYKYYYELAHDDLEKAGIAPFRCEATLTITPYILTDIEFTTQLNLIRLLYTGEAQVPTDISLGGIEDEDVDTLSYRILAYDDNTYTNQVEAIDCGIYYAEFTVDGCEKHNYTIDPSVTIESRRHEFEIYWLIPTEIEGGNGVIATVEGEDVYDGEEYLYTKCDNSADLVIKIKIEDGYVPTEDLALNFYYIEDLEEFAMNVLSGTAEPTNAVALNVSGVYLAEDGKTLIVPVSALGRVDDYCENVNFQSFLYITVEGVVPVVETEVYTMVGINPQATSLEDLFIFDYQYVEFENAATFDGDVKIRVNTTKTAYLDLGEAFGGVTLDDETLVDNTYTIAADKMNTAHALAVVDDYGRCYGYRFIVNPIEINVSFNVEGWNYGVEDYNTYYLGDVLGADAIPTFDYNVTWYTDETYTEEADFTAALTEDVTFYGIVDRDANDFNCDGVVDIADAEYLLNCYAFEGEYAIYNNANVDIDGDSEFTIADIEALLDIINA